MHVQHFGQRTIAEKYILLIISGKRPMFPLTWKQIVAICRWRSQESPARWERRGFVLSWPGIPQCIPLPSMPRSNYDTCPGPWRSSHDHGHASPKNQETSERSGKVQGFTICYKLTAKKYEHMMLTRKRRHNSASPLLWIMVYCFLLKTSLK